MLCCGCIFIWWGEVGEVMDCLFREVVLLRVRRMWFMCLDSFWKGFLIGVFECEVVERKYWKKWWLLRSILRIVVLMFFCLRIFDLRWMCLVLKILWWNELIGWLWVEVRSFLVFRIWWMFGLWLCVLLIMG